MRTRRLVVAACLAAAACTPPETHAPEQPALRRGGVARIGVLGAPATLDPYDPKATDLTRAIAQANWPSLYTFRPDGTSAPGLAADLRPGPEGATVALRAARWSNGRPITASDVVASVSRATRPSGLAGLRARRVDDRTVRLQGRVDDWQRRLAHASFVLPGGKADGRTGGGPFVVEQVVPGLKVRYERNGEANARLDAIEVVFVEEVSTLLDLLERERLDLAWLPSAPNLPARVASHSGELSSALGWESVRLDFFGLARSQRRAVAGAVDRRRLAEIFVRDLGRPATTLAPTPGEGGNRGPWNGASLTGTRPLETVTVAAPNGDELLQLVQRGVIEQLAAEAMDADAIDVEASVLYGGRRPSGTVELIRDLGGPDAAEERGGPVRSRSLPLFHVETLLGGRGELEGPVVNPSVAGPLWNVGEWGYPR